MLTYIFGTLIYLDTDLRLRNRELAMAREAMQVRAEEERQRIAEDLHDETLPALSAVARMADKLTHEMDGSDTPRQMREKLDGAISETRDAGGQEEMTATSFSDVFIRRAGRWLLALTLATDLAEIPPQYRVAG